MDSNNLEALKIEIINSIYINVSNRRDILISYLYYIKNQDIEEFSKEFNFYLWACTPNKDKIPSIAIKIFEDIISFLVENNITIGEMKNILRLPLYDKIAWYIRLRKESTILKILELPEKAS